MSNTPKAVNHLNKNMYDDPTNATQVMSTKEVQETIRFTDNCVIAWGRSYKLKIKNIGVGMKEVSLTRANP